MAEAKAKKAKETVEAELIVEAAPEVIETKTAAKAGKRSAKSLKEADEKQAKEERKTQTSEEAAAEKPKQAARPTRSRVERSGKKFRQAASAVEKDKTYTPSEALELATKTSPVAFDATVELHVNLAVDPKIADQNVRDNLVLPAGTGKQVRIAVFTDEKVTDVAISGVEAITKELEKGTIPFDILIATPANMAKLGKYARLLGPRGLMPNPKSGTVTNDVNKAVAEAKAGRVEYRVDSTGIVHLGIGKVSFGKDKLMENFQAVVTSIKGNKPASVKSGYLKAAYISTTMGPGIRLTLSEL